eukprot:m.258488 g.258488  ORF g.258488 m.258488 type:complete len:205 (-) comp36643_c0_seq1:213-827(-)
MASVEELTKEVAHWKAIAKEHKEEVDEMESLSEDMEKEYQLLQTQVTKERDLAVEQCKDLKSKLDKARKEGGGASDRLTKENNALKAKNEEIALQLQKLEQQNDDFERQVRAIEMSSEGNEEKLESALEDKAFLQSDLEEKEETIAHLESAIKDLQSEIEVLSNKVKKGGGLKRVAPPTKRGEALTMLTLLLKRVETLEAARVG